jgi:hypothetical protein
MLAVVAAEAGSTSPVSVWAPVIAAMLGLIGTLVVLVQKWRNDRASLIQRVSEERKAREQDRAVLRQKTDADRRDAWRKRTQWAIDNALATDDVHAVAVCLAVLQRAGLSDLAAQRDGELLIAVADQIQTKWAAQP